MRAIIFSLFVVFIVSISPCMAGDDYYYNYSEQINLTPTQGYIVVKQDPEAFTSWEDAIEAFDALNGVLLRSQLLMVSLCWL